MFHAKTCLAIDNNLEFKWLVMQTAATVLFICKHQSPTNRVGPGVPGEQYDPIAVLLHSYKPMAAHGHVKMLELQVELVYDFVSLVLSEPNTVNHFLVGPDEARLIIEALATYQNWITAKMAALKARFGSHWGDADDSKDWAGLNKRFLALVEE